MKVFLTGAGGFVGHHTLEHLLTVTDWDIACTDSFRHKGRTDRIAQVLYDHEDWQRRVSVITHDLAAPFTDLMASQIGSPDFMIAMASESHVERSIKDPVPFIKNNVDVLLNTLELARKVRPRIVVVVSTDEVYGPEPVVDGYPVPHPEWSPILPSNPYSASKAAQEAIAVSYWRTFGVPVVIVNCMNLIGERQDPEKFLPMLIRGISRGDTVTIHGTHEDIGTRHYLHARNLADGIVYIMKELPVTMFPAHTGHRRQMIRPGDRPDRYNVVGPDRISNLQLAEMVAAALGAPLYYELVDFHSARPGHDPHYGLDPAKLTAAGWKPPVAFTESLARTVRWSRINSEWLK